jgi:hypothetical protein
MRQHEVMAQLVQMPSGNAGQDMRADHVEAGRRQLPGAAHAREIFGLVNGYFAALAGWLLHAININWLAPWCKPPAALMRNMPTKSWLDCEK